MDFGFCDTTVGKICIVSKGSFIVEVSFDIETVDCAKQCETPVIREAVDQLHAYFDGRLQKFSVPLFLSGTEFMRKVWNALLNIPYGETASYKDVACALGSPQAQRAVGMANRNNKLPIFIPCHRVIRSDGSLGGFKGLSGVDKKKKLLALERKYSQK